MHRSWTTSIAVIAVSAVLGCAHAKPEAPVTAARPAAQPAGRGAGAANAPGAGGAPQRRREAPKPETQDSIRRANLAEVLRSVAGREDEPAGKVFKSVQLNKDMPVKAFLTMMDEQYGRGLGNVCSNCHANTNVAGVIKIDYASDKPKDKTIARKMEAMQQAINKDLKQNKGLDEDYPKATCVMCHRGTAHMPNTMKPLKNTDPPPQTRIKG